MSSSSEEAKIVPKSFIPVRGKITVAMAKNIYQYRHVINNLYSARTSINPTAKDLEDFADELKQHRSFATEELRKLLKQGVATQAREVLNWERPDKQMVLAFADVKKCICDKDAWSPARKGDVFELLYGMF